MYRPLANMHITCIRTKAMFNYSTTLKVVYQMYSRKGFILPRAVLWYLWPYHK